MGIQIKAKSIEAALKKIDNLDEAGLDKLIETYTLKQQNLVDYILQAGMEYENEDLNVFSIYYFAIILEAFHQQNVAVREISTDDIEAFHEPFLMALEELNEAEDFEPIQELVNQPDLQQFIVEEIESPDSDGVVLDEETQTQLFIVTTSIVGLLSSVATT